MKYVFQFTFCFVCVYVRFTTKEIFPFFIRTSTYNYTLAFENIDKKKQNMNIFACAGVVIHAIRVLLLLLLLVYDFLWGLNQNALELLKAYYIALCTLCTVNPQ